MAKSWYLAAAAAVESGMTLAEAAARVDRHPKTLYNERQMSAEFRDLLDAAAIRYHRSTIRAIERIGADQLQPIMNDIHALNSLDPGPRALTRQRLFRTLNRSTSSRTTFARPRSLRAAASSPNPTSHCARLR